MKTRERNCIEDDSYSATQCFKDYLSSQTDCHINWFNISSASSRSRCDSSSLGKYFNFLIELKQLPTAKIISDSGCVAKCRTSQYSVETSRTNINWAANWTASVFIHPKSSLIEYSVEYLSYDFNDLIGDIGGYLGLFLGWSLVTFYDALPLMITFIKAKTKNT